MCYLCRGQTAICPLCHKGVGLGIINLLGRGETACVLCSLAAWQVLAQAALGVLGNIAFPSSRNKEKLITPPFTEDEFTRSPPVALRLPSSDIRNVFPSLLQTSPIELIFIGV